MDWKSPILNAEAKQPNCGCNVISGTVWSTKHFLLHCRKPVCKNRVSSMWLSRNDCFSQNSSCFSRPPLNLFINKLSGKHWCFDGSTKIRLTFTGEVHPHFTIMLDSAAWTPQRLSALQSKNIANGFFSKINAYTLLYIPSWHVWTTVVRCFPKSIFSKTLNSFCRLDNISIPCLWSVLWKRQQEKQNKLLVEWLYRVIQLATCFVFLVASFIVLIINNVIFTWCWN